MCSFLYLLSVCQVLIPAHPNNPSNSWQNPVIMMIMMVSPVCICGTYILVFKTQLDFSKVNKQLHYLLLLLLYSRKFSKVLCGSFQNFNFDAS